MRTGSTLSLLWAMKCILRSHKYILAGVRQPFGMYHMFVQVYICTLRINICKIQIDVVVIHRNHILVMVVAVVDHISAVEFR